MVVVTSGFVTTASGVRFSARSPIPAFTGAACALGVWVVLAVRSRAIAEDLRQIEAWVETHVRWVVATLAGLAALAAVSFNSFSATGSDASGYLSHAQMLLDGKLTYSEPLAAIAKWHGGEATLAPLGWRAIGLGEQVPTYAIGLPLLMAPFHAWGGATAASLLIPLSLALAVAFIAALAYRIAGAPAAIIGAVWLATSPVALVESMQIMSDVPVTAAWMSCWWLAFANRPFAAGLAAALAVLVRPNLAPFAAFPVLVPGLRPWPSVVNARRALAYLIPVLVAGVITAYLQWRWFGSVFRSGYGTAAEIYSLANLAPNASLYARWLLDTHGPWLFAAPFAVFLRAPQGVSRELRYLFAFAAGVVAAYLVYAQFEVWTYLRFLLPALAVAMIGVAVVLSGGLARLPETTRFPLLAVIVLALAFANIASAKRLEVFRFAERHVRARVVGDRLAAMLPVNAAIVTGEQSGAMRYYTGRTIVRWDLLDEDAMREAFDWLMLNGYQIWVVLDDWEEETFRRKLPSLSALSLDYEPSVESAAGVGIRTRAWRARSAIAKSSNND